MVRLIMHKLIMHKCKTNIRTGAKKMSPLKQFLAIVCLFVILQTFMISYKEAPYEIYCDSPLTTGQEPPQVMTSSQTTTHDLHISEDGRGRFLAVRNITTRSFGTHGDDLKVKNQTKAGHIADKGHEAHPEPPSSIAISNNFPALLTDSESFFSGKNNPLVCGKRRKNEGFLTIGIPSVRRPNTEQVYLFDTLDSIVAKTKEAERNLVTVVVFLADFNATFNKHIADELITKYKNLCDEGFLHILIAKKNIYPDMALLRKNFNDSESRVVWRTKQNVDVAFLQLYCKNISKYYLHLEDDVIAANDYFQDLRRRIEVSKEWFIIEFSALGFIGNCFHASDLPRMVKYFLTFHDQMPCDWLLAHLQKMMLPRKLIKSTPSLFQHIGKFSSLKDKILPMVDSKFKDRSALASHYDIPKGDNPPCSIETNMKEVKPFTPQKAYEDNSSHFYTKNAHTGTYFKIMYQKPINLSRIIIATGEKATKRDSLDQGTLSIYNSSDTAPSDACGYSAIVLDFSIGDIDTKGIGIAVPDNVKCLQITAGKRKRAALIIRYIAVFVREP